MRRPLALLLALSLTVATVLFVPGCDEQMVTVTTGEIVICTYGEIVSDTTEDIEVSANEVADHGVTTEVITCDLHTKLAALYDEALRAIERGDLPVAERVLSEIAASDPEFRDIQELLADVRSPSTPREPGGGPSAPPAGQAPGTGNQPPPGNGGATAPDDAPRGPIANLIHYIPDRLPGFIGQRVYSDPFTLFRDYLPVNRGEIRQISIEVEQLQNAEMVQRRIDERIRSYYPNAAQTVKVGSLDAYFGTRRGAAVLAIADGAVLIVMEFATTSTSPEGHRDELISVATVVTRQ